MTQKKKAKTNPLIDLMLKRLANQGKTKIEKQKEIYQKTIELGFNKKGEINE